MNRTNDLFAAISIVLFIFSTGCQTTIPTARGGDFKMAIQVSSEAFLANQTIPKKYTCDGENLSPPLVWSNLPAGTKSVAVVCEDPDAPSGSFIHWLIFNIDPAVTNLPEGVSETSSVKGPAAQGRNGFGKIGYGGPCPPRGSAHHYFFRVYALDTSLGLKPGSTKKELDFEIRGHILDMGEIIGLYAR